MRISEMQYKKLTQKLVFILHFSVWMIKFKYIKIKQGISRSTGKGLEKDTYKMIIKKNHRKHNKSLQKVKKLQK